MRNVSVATRLAVAIVVVAVVSLITTTLVGVVTGDRLSDGLLEAQFKATRTSKADEIETYLDAIANQTAIVAASPMTTDAAQRFTAAYNELARTDPDDLEAHNEELLTFYRDEYVPALEAVRGEEIRIRDVAPATPAGLYLQGTFLAGADEFGVAPRAIDDPADGSAWSEVHRELHPAFRSILDDVGFGDLYLIDPETGAVVYSVLKAPDFATDLEVGPYSGSTLATLVDRIKRAPEKGAVIGADFARYAPGLDRPVGFLGSPVLDGDDLVGVLAVQLPADEINRIMTSDGDWVSQGLGKTGEAFLIGPDDRMRSDSRVYLEDPTAYFSAAEAADTLTPDEANGVAAAGTTIVYQRADTSSIDSALASGESFVESTNYQGRDVFSTVQPINVAGLGWRLIVQVERAEVDQAFSNFRSNLIVSVALFVVVLTFLAVVWAGRVVHPIRRLSDRLRVEGGGGPPEVEAASKPKRPSVREFSQLGASVDQMLDSLAEREVALAAASTERLDVVRNLLPPEIVRRLEAGDRNVVDHVPNATVAALVVDGLGRLVDADSPTVARELLDRSVDTLDTLAEAHGLERVKLVGDTYFAVCGLNNPYLDHAPRAVAFVLDARDAIEELSAADPTRLDVSAGVHSGPVTAGLTGSTRLIYDLWGATVSTAHFLARSARPGEIIVSDETKMRLPPDIQVVARGENSALPTTWNVAVAPTHAGMDR
jgi:class 3 adenylate cyclase